ncbi:glycoside hydrolase [Rhizopus microsporus ATCC 52813]|uniref:Glycoside hydrolase n=1 Tax=Rhizopus microsporus ATCC 52813 TaxID=1340429 RepID=A0A2G4SIA4_RHIZD|nr:glycoside hydrolase [Rhizopus microsporus ATCC 52813]PHZ08504.1 glycoside hydrolase [Rhizopus microsporus ATCC 52813]
MILNLFLGAVIGVASLVGAANAVISGADKKPVVIGYYPNWSDRFTVTKIDFSKFTHIHYAFAIMANGPVPVWGNPQKANAQLTKLVTMAHKHKVKVLPSIGGWTGSITFSSTAKSQKSRKEFIDWNISVMKRYKTDGIDIDWEYPGRQGEGCNEVNEEHDVKNFLTLLKELRQAMDGEFGVGKKEISAAVYIHPFNSSVPEMAKILDRANIMTYDINGPWSLRTGANAPLYAPRGQDSVDSSVNAWIEAGMPRHKIAVGLALYGRSAIAKVNMLRTKKINQNQVQGQISQGDKTDVFFQSSFCPLIPGGLSGTWRFHSLLSQHVLKSPLEANKPWARVWDAVTSTPWLFNSKTKIFISYDDPRSLALKTCYALQKNLAGVMIWSIDQDSKGNDLLNAIHNSIKTTNASC